MHGVTGSPSFGSLIIKVWLLMRFFISLRVAFSQGCLIFSDNFVTSAKFLGSGMKWETSEPDSTKLVNSCKISFMIVLNTLCKPEVELAVANLRLENLVQMFPISYQNLETLQK